MSNWYNSVRIEINNTFDSIVKQNFINELMSGTLPQDKFLFYVQQDALYLGEYKKALATLGTKLNNQNDSQFFLDSASGIMQVEGALHNSFLKDSSNNTTPTPTCELYTSYLSRIVNTQSIETGLAAVLPCFTIYKEVGDYILNNQENKNANVYQNWINTYGGEEFSISVKNAIEITNRYAKNTTPAVREEMNNAFIKASKLEWMFWDSAYNKEQWKI
jgi:thiaminase/transcriptional activator TenA